MRTVTAWLTLILLAVITWQLGRVTAVLQRLAGEVERVGNCVGIP